MEFYKNLILLQHICLVQIRSVDAVLDIPSLKNLYATPSKINLTGSYKQTDSGVIISKKLTLSYPGISPTDFDKFQNLTNGAFQIYVKTTTNDIYEVATQQFFMECSATFNIETGHQLTFSNTSPIPIKYIENQPNNGIAVLGFDYDLNFNLS